MERFALRPVNHRSTAFMEGLERRICMDAPTVTDAEFIFDAWPTRQTISLVFSDDVRQSLDEQDITLENLTTGDLADLGVLAGNFGTALPEPTPEPEFASDGSDVRLADDDEAAFVSA